MILLRQVYTTHLDNNTDPVLISSLSELEHNLETIETYLSDENESNRLDVSLLIKRGTCFVAYRIGKDIRFAPSRFIGYRNNQLNKYPTTTVDGRDTNKAINQILESKPVPNKDLEEDYKSYCIKLGIKIQPKGGAYAITRKYWIITLNQDFKNNDEIDGEFPEGKIVERIHKSRERNRKVIDIAKRNFKNKHGRLFCEVCQFDFEKQYGKDGKDFIEGHHTLAVSDMPPEYKTRPEEIAMLCANCHRMIHKRRPWLSMNELSKLLK